METEHKAHVHCSICGQCMDIPITVLVDMELDNRNDGIEISGLICDTCL